jgi:predicted DCC family thiol-disulfide oxidoreductase YuxK
VDPHTYQCALLAGRLFACCVQLQFEVVGSYRLAADGYSAASRQPAKHIEFATRRAAHWVGETERRNPDARTAALAIWREIQSLVRRLRGMGGVPDVLADRIVQAAFRDGFSTQWRWRPPMCRAERRHAERDIMPSLAPAPAETTNGHWIGDFDDAYIGHERFMSDPLIAVREE